MATKIVLHTPARETFFGRIAVWLNQAFIVDCAATRELV